MKRFELNIRNEALSFAAQVNQNLVTIEKDDKQTELKVLAVRPGRLTIFYNGKSYDVSCSLVGKDFQVASRFGRIDSELKDEYALRREQAGGAMNNASGDVATQMPGKVVEVKVKEGQTVDVDEGVIIVEAMKMQNELKAQVAGVVKKVTVQAGDSVEGGTVLVEIEPAA